MKPIGVRRGRKGFQILHRCTVCGKQQPNRIASDTVQSDWDALLDLMREERN